MSHLAGAVLAGGSSRRMGRDKASIAFEGRSLGVIAVSALRDAGVDPVVVVGGNHGHGAELIADSNPGDGPLAGVLDALRSLDADRVVILPCDLPRVDAAALRRLIDADAASIGAVTLATVDGRVAAPVGIWHREAEASLRARFHEGERSLHAALDALRIELVELGEAARDVDSPEDLAATGTLPSACSRREDDGDPRDRCG